MAQTYNPSYQRAKSKVQSENFSKEFKNKKVCDKKFKLVTYSFVVGLGLGFGVFFVFVFEVEFHSIANAGLESTV